MAMLNLVRKTLEIYLKERRVITQGDLPADSMEHIQTKEAVFVTLYHEGLVVASSGRIQCKKDNSLYECIDNTLLCLKDPRFAPSLQNLETLNLIKIRIDRIRSENRRILQSIKDLDITKEGLIFLSQNLGVISIVLPHMVHVGATPEAYFSLACKKSGIDEKKLTSSDYVIYGFTTNEENDMA